MTKVKRIGALSLAKFAAMLFGALGFPLGLAYAVGGYLTDVRSDSISFGTALAFLAIAGAPLLLAVLGFAAGLLSAWLCNLALKISGGVTIRLEEDL